MCLVDIFYTLNSIISLEISTMSLLLNNPFFLFDLLNPFLDLLQLILLLLCEFMDVVVLLPQYPKILRDFLLLFIASFLLSWQINIS